MLAIMAMILRTKNPLLWDELVDKELHKDIVCSTTVKVRWRCEENHVWSARVSNRVYGGAGCPYCSGRLPIAGINDLATLYPEIHETLVDKTQVFKPSSSTKSLWVCSSGHEWVAAVYSRTSGNGCPVCSGRTPIKGVTDLASVNPLLASELVDPENATLSPKSGKSVEWMCAEGHSWIANVYKRSEGKGCPYCSGRRPIVGKTDLVTSDPDLFEEQVDKSIVVSRGSGRLLLWRCEDEHEWEATVYNRASNKSGCPKCYSITFRSRAEAEIAEIVEGMGFTVSNNNRTRIKGVELDVYVPEKEFAIEYNGLYWHSEWNHDKWYHHNKWKKCNDEDVRLIQIWEDEWIDRKEIVLAKIQNLLDPGKNIGARKTQVVSIDYETSSGFLDTHHIQGRASGSNYWGLTLDGMIVGVAVFRKSAGKIYLDRYASSLGIMGGLDKLMKANGPGEYVTFADHCVSNGDLYEKTGWALDKELRPDYKYVRSGVKIREHKFGYRLKRFKSDLHLKYVEGMTERELAELNNIYRIWDAGKSRYIKTIK